MSLSIGRTLALGLPAGQSAFLWGPRKIGKSYWIRQHYADAVLIDLLRTDVFAEYASRPALLRERFADHAGLIVVDEVQMAPDLLNEVHWLIENRGTQFLLTGSSARKLRRVHANLLGGRAWRYEMRPLTWLEVGGYDPESVTVSGLLPPHFLASDPVPHLRAYVGDYLKEEIASEARAQSIPAFAEFIRVSAVTNGELLNYTNVAREAGVSSKAVRGYFQILEDTLLGFRLPPWRRVGTRRLIETEKFYWFDVGVASFLARRRPRLGTPEFGKAFEHLMLMELRAWQAYRQPDTPLSFWRTASGFEVDIILGDMRLAVEIKGSSRVHDGDMGGLRALRQEHAVGQAVVVCFEKMVRRTPDGVLVLPWQEFLTRLWSDTWA